METSPEGGLERICGIVALLFWTVVIVGGLGVTIIVGVSEIAPRQAALVMALPVLVLWGFASCNRGLRQAALTVFPPFT